MSLRVPVVAVLVLLLLAGCGGSDDEGDARARPSASGTPRVAAPTPTLAPVPELTDLPPGTVDLTDGGSSPGAAISRADDLATLESTSPQFRDFIDRTLGSLSTGYCERAPSVTVHAYDPRGFAVGTVQGCDGYRAYWADAGGWTEVAAATSGAPCEALEAAGFPRALVGETCVEAGGGTRAYAGPA